ncbi:MAG: ABC transporter ATP-binding protein [Chloroflexi bacterium]|nr:ABC transporter ATP-binding protein [Chloroflexota bacterium]MCI0578335.1 ABC transporter ATP-binding protein [Chloroflexota bacterium]MCI0648997.1 ABC transporter ATP-binding protein [Chloroflexota bacterium]MCI0729432.1 ABC transporter ATP-binding protein [Chloroflexota bacterium]
MRGIVKRFPGVLANDRVDFDVRTGEIHALLGENGAGKSTLMKILYGLYQPNEGEIRLNGRPVTINSPADSIRLGIGMIHQHFMLVPTLTVAENVALGLPSSRGPLTDLDQVARRIDELARIYGLQMDPDATVWQLSVGQQQRVEIMKALYRGAALLILDEPTAVLTPQEVEEFFTTLQQMAERGHALIFISHKLAEVLRISQRVTVLRDGRVVHTLPTGETTKEELAQMMVGRPVTLQRERPAVELGELLLQLEEVWAQSDRETPALRGVSLAVRAGEIVGLAGVSGNGQVELAQVIAGLRPASGGRVLLEGEEITGRPPGQIMEQGLAYIPEERMKDGMIRNFSVAENLILREHGRPPYARSGFFNFRAISRRSAELIRSFNVKTPSQETPVKNLSGGNIQKLILARELSRQPRVLVAAQPTRGLDIGATEYVHLRLLQQRQEGTATLLISEDLDEILALSDRIAVIYEGRIMGEVAREEATAEKLGLLMAGI